METNCAGQDQDPQGEIWWSCPFSGCKFSIDMQASPRRRTMSKYQHNKRHKGSCKALYGQTRELSNKAKSETARDESDEIWWKCPKCPYKISKAVPDQCREGRKNSHIICASCRHPRIALRKNFKSRSKMLRTVWEGSMTKTAAGLTKGDLMISWRGRVVPKKRSAHSKKLAVQTGWAQQWRHWCRAHKAVREELDIRGFFKAKKNGSVEEKELYEKVLDRAVVFLREKEQRKVAAGEELATVVP